MPSAQPRHILLALLAGASALVVVHGLGRFAFTPLLPHLIADGLLSLEQGARLATWNYIGYLLGALLALALHAPARMRVALPVALLLNAALTLAQGFTEDYSSLLWLRLANGISNGVVFVQAPALVLEWLAQQQRTRLSGLIYLGLGGGLLLSSGVADWPAAWFDGAARWWPVAALALPLAVLSACLLARLTLQPHPTAAQHPSSALFDRASTPLFLAYAGAGLGYILPMTFLPALAREQLPADDPLLSGAWRWTALASLASIALWNHLGARLGDRRALLANYAAQAVGVAAPLLWPGQVGVLLCAVLVGGTFIGSVFLTQRLARSLHPHQGPRLSAALIALYGGSQLAGPWFAEQWLAHGGSLGQSFALGAAALLWALAWSYHVPRTPQP
ncbi:YbfB/YjiJ family MFS transporter [Pseudomonas sp. UBA2684]|uniref:YbfB/YjiJ family MFS transporter n=1 Tax=Pseudomonas sp. UBA2684 TaxID=1947311 RepID=UPI000E98BC09|nr:YbfB/YjiJ family MFS transporter [Pseudomonas sp. UBA2684]HBX56911.1 MFS transporter [Pseudomonas sp.]|tara:strand:- start:2647 stop:3819 length:1173 start_codon:yes stop_codon:yes gene_type:complete